VNFRQVEIFKAVMEGGSVTQAANSLNIAQPSVSKHLKLLEYSLDLTLFQRSGNQLIPTPEGLALFDQVERVYTGLGFLKNFAEDLRNNQFGELSVATMPLIAQKWLPKCIANFIAGHHKVSFSLPVRSSSWIATAVASRLVHFGIGLNPGDRNPGIRVTPLMKLPFVCVMPPQHPLTEQSMVRLDMLEGHDLISLHSFEGQPVIFERLANDFQSAGKRKIETFATNVACELVKQGAGVALVDSLTARDSLSDTLTYRLFEPKVAMEICIMTPEHWPLSRISSNLIDVMMEQAQQTEKELAALTGY
jgi:DNA-binding transcriptional LysR family regulator